MAGLIVTERVAALVEEMTTQVIEQLGPPPGDGLHTDGVRHVLRLQLGKVVAAYLQRAATEQTPGRAKP